MSIRLIWFRRTYSTLKMLKNSIPVIQQLKSKGEEKESHVMAHILKPMEQLTSRLASGQRRYWRGASHIMSWDMSRYQNIIAKYFYFASCTSTMSFVWANIMISTPFFFVTITHMLSMVVNRS